MKRPSLLLGLVISLWPGATIASAQDTSAAILGALEAVQWRQLRLREKATVIYLDPVVAHLPPTGPVWILPHADSAPLHLSKERIETSNMLERTLLPWDSHRRTFVADTFLIHVGIDNRRSRRPEGFGVYFWIVTGRYMRRVYVDVTKHDGAWQYKVHVEDS